MTQLIYGLTLVFAASFLGGAVLRRFPNPKTIEWRVTVSLVVLLCAAMALDIADFGARNGAALYWQSFIRGLGISSSVALAGFFAYTGYHMLRSRTN